MKVIIPDLVSLNTDLKRIKGFNLAESLTFYPSVEQPLLFNYSVVVQENIDLPTQYDFRNGYYYRSGGSWFYERKIFGGKKLAFSYNPETKEFFVNKLFLHVPFEIGGIFPFGKHLSDLINLDLFLQDYVIFRGCSVLVKNKTISVVGPSFSGKTSFMQSSLKDDSKYIAEDILVINFFKKTICGSGPHFSNFGRIVNKKLHNQLTSRNIIREIRHLDKLFFITNSTNESENNFINKDPFEFLLLSSLFFLNNPFIRSYIFEKKLTRKLFKKIESYNMIDCAGAYANIKNFKFDKLIS
jgi:hypothetical protein